MLVFFIVLNTIIVFVLMLYFSTIKVEIDKLKIDNLKKMKINDFNIKVYLILFDKLKWIKIKINKEKIENIKKLNLKIIKNFKNTNFIKTRGTILKTIKGFKIKIEKLDLNAEIGIDNIIILSYLIAILDILIGISLAKQAKDMEENKYRYIITPRQTNKLYLNLCINCAISAKISNIAKISCNLK